VRITPGEILGQYMDIYDAAMIWDLPAELIHRLVFLRVVRVRISASERWFVNCDDLLANFENPRYACRN